MKNIGKEVGRVNEEDDYKVEHIRRKPFDVDSQKRFAGINKDIVHINEEKDSKKDGDVGMGIAISGWLEKWNISLFLSKSKFILFKGAISR